jgi:hypothetical protein
MATLDLPDDPRTAVWRLIVARLQADAALAGAVPTWLVWDGASDSNADLASKRAPVLRLYPVLGPMSWYSAESQQGALVVAVEAYIPGLDCEDVLNLQGAIEAALYPQADADQFAFQRSLVAAGAVTGYILFGQPLSQPPPQAGGSGAFRPMGTFRVDVERRLIR